MRNQPEHFATRNRENEQKMQEEARQIDAPWAQRLSSFQKRSLKLGCLYFNVARTFRMSSGLSDVML